MDINTRWKWSTLQWKEKVEWKKTICECNVKEESKMENVNSKGKRERDN